MTPSLNDDLSFSEGVEDFSIEQFIPEFAVEGFAVSVLPGLPGSMYSVFEPTEASQRRRFLATISGPLSERRYAGTP
jgi:hypothetical protein